MGGRECSQRLAVSTGLKQRHARNTGITESKGKNVSKATNHVQTRTAYVVPKSENKAYQRKKGREKKKHVPIPITVPYSDFLSSAETEGGQRRMRAMKRKKAKEREERRREARVLDGRDMLRGRKVATETRLEPIFFIFEKGHVVSNAT